MRTARTFPVTSLPVHALRNDAKPIIACREPTGLNDYATLVLNGEIGELAA